MQPLKNTMMNLRLEFGKDTLNNLAELTHCGRVTNKCVSKLTTIGLDNGLSPDRRQAIIWTNAGILLTRPLGTNFSEILIEIRTFSFKKVHLKMSRPQCIKDGRIATVIPRDIRREMMKLRVLKKWRTEIVGLFYSAQFLVENLVSNQIRFCARNTYVVAWGIS